MFTSRHPSSVDQAPTKPIDAAKFGLERLHFIIFEGKFSARSALKLVRAGSPFLLRPNPTAKRSSRI